VHFSVISESGVVVYAVPRHLVGATFEPGETATLEVSVRLVLTTGSFSASVSMVSEDLITGLAAPPDPLLFYVSNDESGASGIADLGAELRMTSARPAPGDQYALLDAETGPG
jgi:hypothetical protein